MEKRKLIVDNPEVGSRLDIFMSQKNNDLTRSYIKKVLMANKVFVNGQVEYRANYRVKVGDKVEFEVEVASENTAIKAQKIELDIVYEDDDIVIINKQSGMVVHPGSGHEENTLVNALRYKYKNIGSVGEGYRSGLIHRLDKDTSGLLMVAKTNKALSFYAQEFAERNVEKEYLAVSYGELSTELKVRKFMILQNYLKRKDANRQKYSVHPKEGKFAHSDIYHITSEAGLHLMKVKIHTGRTHQIRVHLAHIGNPVLGDIKYGRKKYDRLMLHAWRIRVRLMNGEEREFEAGIPQEFKKLFKKYNWKKLA